jgi:hypothetical protein
MRRARGRGRWHSALDLGTAKAQAQWLDKVLTGNPQPWTIVLLHQPFYSPREGRENAALRDVLLPVVRRHNVDLVLQATITPMAAVAKGRPRRRSTW